ncbi:MAG: AAA family ATPase [Limnochordia bacterium]
MGTHYPPRDQNEILRQLVAGQLATGEALRLMRQIGRPKAASSVDKEAEGESLAQILAELDTLIGLQEVKELVREIQAFVDIQSRRQEEGLCTEPTVMHMVFMGNPGTGKTTVARIFGKMFRAMGVLPKGHLVEVERADLVGAYIGHTALKTKEQLKNAMGGILFIDEAYALARGGEKDFGKEAIDTLVKAMEDHKNQFILILAGYQEEMKYFIQTNPGLRSRFPIHIEFPDYSLKELLQIAELFLHQRQYRLTPGAKAKLERILAEAQRERNFGNARMVRNLIEGAMRAQALRLVHKSQLSREELMLITAQDLVRRGVE